MGAVGAMIGVAAAGTAISAYGQYRAGKASQKASEANARAIERAAGINVGLIEEGQKFNQEILEYNALAAEAQARDAIQRGREAEGVFRKQIRGFIGEQKAGYATQGVDIGAYSPVDIQADVAYQAELDALTLRTNAAREAWGYETEARNIRLQAEAGGGISKLQVSAERELAKANAAAARAGGQAAARAATFGAIGTVIGGASEVYLTRYAFQQANAPPRYTAQMSAAYSAYRAAPRANIGALQRGSVLAY